MKHTIQFEQKQSEVTMTINGKKFVKVGHRWCTQDMETARSYSEALKDLHAAIARFEKTDKRLEGYKTEAAKPVEQEVEQ
jgi:hypothetical protein